MIETITCLRPNMSREQLFRAVLPTSAIGRLRALVSPVHGVADVYVPFYVFRVEITNGARRETRQVAIDAVSGTLDLYSADDDPPRVQVSSRNCIPARTSVEDAQGAVVEKVRRMVYHAGFFAVRDLQISAALITTVHVPYWVAMTGSERDLRLRVFDAVRCRPEGAKVRTLIRQWLLAS